MASKGRVLVQREKTAHLHGSSTHNTLSEKTQKLLLVSVFGAGPVRVVTRCDPVELPLLVFAGPLCTRSSLETTGCNSESVEAHVGKPFHKDALETPVHNRDFFR